MPTMKQLSLQLTSGLLTDLQSDTILGHFCWRLRDRLGEEHLTRFINRYLEHNPVFLISDGMLERNGDVLFPKPKFVIHADTSGKSKKQRLISMVRDKAAKSRDSVTLQQLNLFLKGLLPEYTQSLAEATVVPPEFTNELRIHVSIDRETGRSLEGQLFSYHPKYLPKDVRIACFVKVLDNAAFSDFDCEDTLTDVFTLGFGKKKSSGYGAFKILSFEDFNGFEEPDNPNGFVVLGNYLPSTQDEATPVGYAINTKHGKLGEEYSLSGNPFKNPIIFLTSGSCFKTTATKSFYGRVTGPGEISAIFTKAVQFGMPFSLNARLA